MAEAIILGAVAGETLHQILQLTFQIVRFSKNVERLRNTLKRVIPLFKEGSELDLKLNDRKDELAKFEQQLQEGKVLLEKCRDIKGLRIFMKIYYSRKLSDLDQTIRSFCDVDLQMDIWCDQKHLRYDFQQIQTTLDEVLTQLPQQKQVLGVGNLFNEALLAVPKIPDRVVGFGTALEELKTGLFKENVSVIGICAPGGCGKSTLAAMLCRDKQIKDKFKHIFFVNVPRTPKPALEILQRLLKEIGGEVPVSNMSEEDATEQFHYLLERKSEPLLLVLDDVWDQSVIEKFFSSTKGYKLLVTSREAFKIYKSRHHFEYVLKPLNQQDSMTLFRETALSKDGNEDYEPDEDILNKIITRCDGFPLALIVIGKSLFQQPAKKWAKVARKLLEGASIADLDEKIRKCLATSLDYLDKTVLECFLDLSSFPEDKRISAPVLIDIWSELYKLECEDDAYLILVELAARNLVNLVGSRKIGKDIDASFNELFVTQHDLLRDLAIYYSKQPEHQSKRLIMDKIEKGLPESWSGQENHYLNARLVSLCTGEMCPESWYDLQLPEVEVLILRVSASNYLLPPFIGKMRKLKVLTVANHGRTKAKLSNLTALSELANLKRIRLEKVLIPSLHEFTMPFVNLRKISLVMCDFGQALMKCTVNVPNVLPNLVEINIDYCDGLVELPPWICDIINLQTLSITSCDKFSALPERIGNIEDIKLLRLHACTGLSKLPDSIKGFQKLRFLDISDCCNLKKLPDVMGKLCCLKKLDMRGCIDISELPPSAMNLVHHLKEVICDEDHVNLWEDLSSSLKITVPEKDINLDWLGVDIGQLT